MHRYHHEFSDSQTHHGSSQPQERDFTRPNPFADTHTPETYQSYDALRQSMHPQYQNQGQIYHDTLPEVAHTTQPSLNPSDIDIIRNWSEYGFEPQGGLYPNPETFAFTDASFQPYEEFVPKFVDPFSTLSALPDQSYNTPLPPPGTFSHDNLASDGTETLNQPAQEAPSSEDNFLRLGSPYETDDEGVRHPIDYNNPMRLQGRKRHIYIHEKKKGPTKIARDVNTEREKADKPTKLPDGTDLELTGSDISNTTQYGHKIKQFENLSIDAPALREKHKNTRDRIKKNRDARESNHRATRLREYIKAEWKIKILSTNNGKYFNSVKAVLDYVQQSQPDHIYQAILGDPQIQAIQQETKRQSKRHRPQEE